MAKLDFFFFDLSFVIYGIFCGKSTQTLTTLSNLKINFFQLETIAPKRSIGGLFVFKLERIFCNDNLGTLEDFREYFTFLHTGNP